MVADREPRLMELLYLPADKDSRPLTWFAQSSFTSLSLDYSLSPPPSLSQRKDKGVRRKEALATVTLSLSAVLSPGRLHSHQSYLSALEAHGMSHYLAGDSHNTGSGVNLVSDIPGFTWHPSPNGSGSGSIVWTVILQPGEQLIATLPCVVQHRHRDGHAADASRGVNVPPAVVSVCSDNGSGSSGSSGSGTPLRCWIIDTQGQTVQAPIPDFPMPFHVITLVSTALAFLVGSLVNVIFRGNGKKEKAVSKTKARSEEALETPIAKLTTVQDLTAEYTK